VLGWLVKVVLVLTILGGCLLDGIDPDATVHLRLRGTAATLLLHRLPRMGGLTRVEVDGSGQAVLS